ncbi:MAG: hypothetical protein K9L66_04995 [Spirochaetaceae bacterium]|nr:hypothetical protein [Spirochaetaceae bacterium]MCF7948531.1 hypothetical protein [Spirochaetia bacterium]MCF7951009.1 hypothetical protein [Spirochaetaceae bacterium]
MTNLQKLAMVVEHANELVDTATVGGFTIFTDEDPEEVRNFLHIWLSASTTVECEIANYLDNHILTPEYEEAKR